MRWVATLQLVRRTAGQRCNLGSAVPKLKQTEAMAIRRVFGIGGRQDVKTCRLK